MITPPTPLVLPDAEERSAGSRAGLLALVAAVVVAGVTLLLAG